MTQADVQQRAERDVRRAVERMLTRNGCRIAESLGAEIHQAYTGRFDLRPLADTGYCPTHQSTRTPCGLCPPGV